MRIIEDSKIIDSGGYEEMKNIAYNVLAGLIYAAPLVWIILFEVGK